MVFSTIYVSNIPIDCHILKGRLESEGFDTYIFDENIVWVHPFRAVAIGGVKLNVPFEQASGAKLIIESISNNQLVDNDGIYDVADALDKAILRQNEILRIKSQIRKNEGHLDKAIEIKYELLASEEIEQIIKEENEFSAWSQKIFRFSWNEFWAELFDFDGQVFKYLRQKPVDYYIDKELVDLYDGNKKDNSIVVCPRCQSDNVSYGYAIDYKWDIPYLILSVISFMPFPLFRKKFHCFDCGNDFKKLKTSNR
jgi:hypothetical protein